MDYYSDFKRLLRWAALALLVVPIVAVAQTATGVGFTRIMIPDPVNGGTMPGYVFYPSARAKGYTWQGPYKLKATDNAPPIPGEKPIIGLL